MIQTMNSNGIYVLFLSLLLAECYNKSNLPEAFQHAEKIQVDQLHLNENNRQCIIKEISHIQFHSLKILGLSQNRIQNIQILADMRLPMLQGLSLVDNCITSIKPLRRFIFSSNMFVIGLQQNFITDFSPLCQMPYERKLRQIGINYMQDTLCADSLSWAIKLSNQNFKQLCNFMSIKGIGQQNRIKRKIDLEVLRRKFIAINVIVYGNW